MTARTTTSKVDRHNSAGMFQAAPPIAISLRVAGRLAPPGTTTRKQNCTIHATARRKKVHANARGEHPSVTCLRVFCGIGGAWAALSVPTWSRLCRLPSSATKRTTLQTSVKDAIAMVKALRKWTLNPDRWMFVNEDMTMMASEKAVEMTDRAKTVLEE